MPYKDPEKKKAYMKMYVRKNINEYKKRVKIYRKNRREHTRRLLREKYQNDPYYRLCCNLRSRVKMALERGYKLTSTEELIGTTFTGVMEHLESQFEPWMTWENHGAYNKRFKTWHIDHIIPVDAFDLREPEQQRKCFHYTNLRPLLAKDNLTKHASIISSEPDSSLQNG